MLTYSCVHFFVYMCGFICFSSCLFLLNSCLELYVSYFPAAFYLFTYFLYFSSIHLSTYLCNHLVLLIDISYPLLSYVLSMAVWCRWTVGSFWIWECMWFMCIVRVWNLYGSSCKNSFQTWQKWVYFMYEFMSNIKKVDLGGGGRAYKYMCINHVHGNTYVVFYS